MAPAKFRILITAPYFLPVVERFRAELEAASCELVVCDVEERLEEHDLLGLITDIDGVICGDDRFTARVLEKANRLKVVAKWGTGIDSIDQEACKQHGVVICNTLNAFTDPVADTTLAYALSFVRNVHTMDRAMKAGEWVKIPGRAMDEITFGIIGVGNIGSAVAKRVAAFGSRILGHDIHPIQEQVLQATGMTSVDLSTLLQESDIVSLHCDLNPTSHHLIREETLALFKPGTYLINTARGPVIEQESMCWALQSGLLAGVGLDVFEHEPLPLDSPLRSLPQALVAPHNSNSSPKAWEKVHRSTVDQMVAVLENRHA